MCGLSGFMSNSVSPTYISLPALCPAVKNLPLKGVEKRERSCTVGGNWSSHYGEYYGGSLGIKLPYDPAIPILSIYPEKTIIQRHV